MKKRIIGIFIFIFCCIMTGCGKTSTDVCRSGNSFLEIHAVYGDRYLYENGDLLYMQDIETNQSMILCSKPECDHSPYDEETNPNPECEAATRPGSNEFLSVGMDDNRVYAFESTKNANEMVLYSMKLGGGGWTKVAVFPFMINGEADSYYKDGYVYLDAYVRDKTKQGSDDWQEETCIVKIRLSNGKYEQLGTKYKALDWCHMKKLDYSNGYLCYENDSLKEGYTQKDLEETSGDLYELLFQVTVAVIDLKTGKEECMEFDLPFVLNTYITFCDGKLYYKDAGMIQFRDLKNLSERKGIGEIAENVTAQDYAPYGIMYVTDHQEKIYDLHKGRFQKMKKVTEEAKDYTTSILAWNEQYVRVINWGKNDKEIGKEWITWKSFIDGIRTSKQEDELKDRLEKEAGKPQKEETGIAVQADEPELNDDYYEEHWKGKTILEWWNQVNIQNHVIKELNDTLVKQGKDYVIRFHYVENYEDEYYDKLVTSKKNGDNLDLFVTPSQMEGKKEENKYEKCAKADLMEPLNDYLASAVGKNFYQSKYKKQWEGLEINQKIYSYDWRTMPVTDVCAYINQDYIDKYKLNIKKDITLEELFQMAQKVAEKEQSKSLIPILYISGMKESDLKYNPLDGLDACREKYPKLFHFWDTAQKDGENLDVFMVIGNQDFIKNSDTSLHIQQTQSMTVRTVILQKNEYVPVTNSLTAVASWSKHKKQAMDFIATANTDKTIASILEFGVEGQDYTLSDGRVRMINANAWNPFSIGNTWITPAYQLEPDKKENAYRDYLKRRLSK